MSVTADTNVLVRAAMMDDPIQSPRAARLLGDAEAVVATPVALCEFVWVLRAVYRQDTASIAAAIGRLLSASKVRTDRAAAEAGLAVLEAGGDFADGIIAHTGAAAGGERFASFDRKALKSVADTGRPTIDLNSA